MAEELEFGESIDCPIAKATSAAAELENRRERVLMLRLRDAEDDDLQQMLRTFMVRPGIGTGADVADVVDELRRRRTQRN